MDLAAHLRAVEALMSPLDWGGQDAWLAESLRRVRDARGLPSSAASASAFGELEDLLQLPGDEPGWMHAALGSTGANRRGIALPPTVPPAMTAASEHLLPVVSLRRALTAGLATLQRQHAWRNTLGQALDDADTGMAIFSSHGLRELTRNARWGKLLEEEPERDRLLELITRQVAQAAASAGCQWDDDGELELSGRSYRLVASRATAGTLLPEAAVLVLMDRVSPALPTTQELRLTFGLRGREPQVALLAAEGLSNAAIAQRLRLSAHTVRHYLERVLERLDLHSRKALALRLLGNGERSQPPDGR